MPKQHIHSIHAKRIALRAAGRLECHLAGRGRACFRLVFPFLEGIEVIEDVVPHLFQIFRDIAGCVLLFKLLDKPIDEHGSGFLLQIAELARQLSRKRQRLAINDGELLTELFVFALQFLRREVFEFPLRHKFGYVFDGHHLPIENRKNFRQRHRAHLHVPERKLLARNPPREIVHQLFFAQCIPVDDPPLLPLEGLPFEHLWNTPPQEVDPRLHVFSKAVGLAARQRQQPGTVGVLEIIDVAAVRSGLASRL